MSDPNAGGESQNQPVEGGQPQQPDANAHLAFFPEELRGEKTLHKFTGKDKDEVFAKIAKSYVHLEKFQIPGDDATPEQRAAFHRRLGVPEKVEDFKIAPQIPEGVPWNDAVQGEFVKFAHEKGLTPKAAEAVVNWWAQRAQIGVDASTEQSAKQLKAAMDTQKQKWGANYNRNVGLVQRAVEEYGDPNFKALLDTPVPGQEGMVFGSHPVVLDFLLNHGEQRLEAGYIAGDTLLTKGSDAQAEIDKIRTDAKHPYWNKDAPGHKEAVAHFSKQMSILHPESSR